MHWYLPITIIPGLGMLILSTVTQMLGVSNEINALLEKQCNEFQHSIAKRKIKQLGLLTRANALLYLSIGFYVLSGILGIAFESDKLLSPPSITLYIGTLFIFVAIVLLISYAFKAVKIREDQFDYNFKTHKG